MEYLPQQLRTLIIADLREVIATANEAFRGL